MSFKRFERRKKTGSRYKNFLQSADDDPLGGVANLFDVAMVFAVALILAMFHALNVPELLTATDDVTIVKNPGKPNMEIIKKEGVKLEKYRMTDQRMNGQGQRLGVCYKLANGEVVYVPESVVNKKIETPEP